MGSHALEMYFMESLSMSYPPCLNISTVNPIVGTIAVLVFACGTSTTFQCFDLEVTKTNPYIIWLEVVEDGCFPTIIQSNTDDLSSLSTSEVRHKCGKESHSRLFSYWNINMRQTNSCCFGRRNVVYFGQLSPRQQRMLLVCAFPVGNFWACPFSRPFFCNSL